MSHVLRITTWGAIYKEILFGVSKEWVRSWSQTFLVTNLKLLAKKLLTVRPKGLTRKRDRREKKAIAKHFALHSNAIKLSSENLKRKITQNPLETKVFLSSWGGKWLKNLFIYIIQTLLIVSKYSWISSKQAYYSPFPYKVKLVNIEIKFWIKLWSEASFIYLFMTK